MNTEKVKELFRRAWNSGLRAEADEKYPFDNFDKWWVMYHRQVEKLLSDTHSLPVDKEAKLIEKVKEAWTPDHRSFEDAEKTVEKTMVNVEKMRKKFMIEMNEGLSWERGDKIFDWFVNYLNLKK